MTQLAPVLDSKGISIRGVRLDSGDLAEHARNVRRILDDAGLASTQIVASGGIDEYELDKLSDSPIDIFGIGTSLVTSDDTPALDCAYKLKSYAEIPRRKRSEGKAFWPGATQASRQYSANGRMAIDVIGRADEPAQGQTLLRPIVRNGVLTEPLPDLSEIRALAARQMALLPAHLGHLETSPAYPVAVTEALRQLADDVDQRIAAQEDLANLCE